jgi:hypothetical protein
MVPGSPDQARLRTAAFGGTEEEAACREYEAWKKRTGLSRAMSLGVGGGIRALEPSVPNKVAIDFQNVDSPVPVHKQTDNCE